MKVDDNKLQKLLQIYDYARSTELNDDENHLNGIKTIYLYLEEERLVRQMSEIFVKDICLKNLDLAYGVKEEKEKTTGSR